MDSRRDLYKQRGRTGQDRSVRAKASQAEQKNRRHDVVARRRQLALPQLQEKEEEKVSKKPLTTTTQKAHRLDRLKEWKRQKEERKKQEAEKKRRPFFAGGMKEIATTHNNHPPSKQVLGIDRSNLGGRQPKMAKVAKPTQKTVKTPPSVPVVAPSNSTAATKARVTKPVMKSQKPQSTSSTLTKKNPGSSAKPSTVAPRNSQRTRKCPSPTTTRVSSQIAARQSTKEPIVKATRRQAPTRRNPNSKVQVAKATPRTVSAKKKSNSQTSRPKNTPPSISKPTISDAGTADTLDKSIEAMDIAVPHGVITPTHCDILVGPSIEEVARSLPLVSDPAWIPGAKPKTPGKFKGFASRFDEAFGTSPFHVFSPFQFIGGNEAPSTKSCTPSNQPFSFHFRKSFTATPSSLGKNPLSQARKRLSGLRLSSGRIIEDSPNCLVLELDPSPPSEPSAPLVSEDSFDETAQSPTAKEWIQEEEEGGINFRYFYGLHSGVTEKLTSICELWDEKLSNLEAEVVNGNSAITEDVLGQVRTTIGQGRLLMRQKLKQYLGLVEEAESKAPGEGKTTAEDLQGFWDMVYFQVEDVHSKFEQLGELERNDWQEAATKKPKAKRRKKCPTVTSTKSSSTASSGTTERQQAAREKREAARRKLRELKAAAAAKRETEKMDSEVEETIQPGGAVSEPSPPSIEAPLIFFSPEPLAKTASLVSPSQSSGGSSVETSGGMGAFMCKFVSITPSKKVRELVDADIIMSPARRSIRIAGRGINNTPRSDGYILSSLTEMPEHVDFGYLPNPTLM